MPFARGQKVIRADFLGGFVCTGRDLGESPEHVLVVQEKLPMRGDFPAAPCIGFACSRGDLDARRNGLLAVRDQLS
jgi:hypothetical protein